MLDSTLVYDNRQAIAAGAAVGSFIAVIGVVGIIFTILMIIAGWKIFKKAGEPGWKILIPIYGEYIFLKIIGLKNWFWASILISLITCITFAVCNFNVSVFYMNDNMAAGNYLSTYSFSTNPMVAIMLCISAIFTIILGILSAYRLSKAFGHGIGYTLGNLFLPGIFWLIIGFGSSKYSKKAVKA